jgi:hypothetical protein
VRARAPHGVRGAAPLWDRGRENGAAAQARRSVRRPRPRGRAAVTSPAKPFGVFHAGCGKPRIAVEQAPPGKQNEKKAWGHESRNLGNAGVLLGRGPARRNLAPEARAKVTPLAAVCPQAPPPGPQLAPTRFAVQLARLRPWASPCITLPLTRPTYSTALILKRISSPRRRPYSMGARAPSTSNAPVSCW